MKRAFAIVGVSSALLAGCAGQTEAPPPESATDTHEAVLQAEKSNVAPPPAWIEAASGNRRLALSTYCWRAERTEVCGDYAAPSCADERVPKITVRQGEGIRFHLGFKPRAVELQLATRKSAEGAQYRLRPAKVTDWRASGERGLAALSAHSEPGLVPGGDASYVVCLEPQ